MQNLCIQSPNIPKVQRGRSHRQRNVSRIRQKPVGYTRSHLAMGKICVDKKKRKTGRWGGLPKLLSDWKIRMAYK